MAGRVCGGTVGGRWALTILPGPRGPGPAPPPPPPRPRLALGVLPQLLLMTCSCRSARSARSRSSSMNCCSRSLALASRAAVSFRNWSICTTSLGPEQSLTPGPRPGCPPTPWRSPRAGGRATAQLLPLTWVHAVQAQAQGTTPRHAHKCNHTLRVTHARPTAPAPTVLLGTPTPHGNTLSYAVALRATSSVRKHSRAHSHTHSRTRAHVTFTCKSTRSLRQAQSRSHIPTHTRTHTFRNILRCRRLREVHTAKLRVT